MGILERAICCPQSRENRPLNLLKLPGTNCQTCHRRPGKMLHDDPDILRAIYDSIDFEKVSTQLCWLTRTSYLSCLKWLIQLVVFKHS